MSHPVVQALVFFSACFIFLVALGIQQLTKGSIVGIPILLGAMIGIPLIVRSVQMLRLRPAAERYEESPPPRSSYVRWIYTLSAVTAAVFAVLLCLAVLEVMHIPAGYRTAMLFGGTMLVFVSVRLRYGTWWP